MFISNAAERQCIWWRPSISWHMSIRLFGNALTLELFDLYFLHVGRTWPYLGCDRNSRSCVKGQKVINRVLSSHLLPFDLHWVNVRDQGEVEVNVQGQGQSMSLSSHGWHTCSDLFFNSLRLLDWIKLMDNPCLHHLTQSAQFTTHDWSKLCSLNL